MNRKTYLLVTWLVLVCMLLGASGVFAQGGEPPSEEPAQADGGSEYLLLLSHPHAEEMNVPANLSWPQAYAFAQSLVSRQARDLRIELEHYRQQGKISDYQMRPEQNAISVRLADLSVRNALTRLPGIESALPAAQGEVCAQKNMAALHQQVLGMSRVKALRQWSPVSPQATDPSINIQATLGSEWTYVWGVTTADIPVTMRILRGGVVIAEQTGYSYSDGYFDFYPYYINSCGEGGYDWILQAGDVVEITAHGTTVSTVVASLTGWVDPGIDVVQGFTDPGRVVEIRLRAPESGCSYTGFDQTVTPAGDGSFSVDFTDQANFDRRAYAYVYSRDGNGNSTQAYFHAFFFARSADTQQFWGSLKPNVDFTVQLKRGGSMIESHSWRTDSEGEYSGFFNQPVQNGDVIEAHGGGVAVTHTVFPFTASTDFSTDRAAGVAGAGLAVSVNFEHQTSGSLMTSCSYEWSCASGTTGLDGSFSLAASPVDVKRGDAAYFYVYDGEGNYLYATRAAPAIGSMLDEVYGYWAKPDASLTVTVKDAGNVVKETVTDVRSDDWDSEFKAYLASNALPGYHIEVTDGTLTETMTVQNLTASLNNNTEHLTGSATNGSLVVDYNDFQPGSGSYGSCYSTVVSSGAFDFDLTPWGVEASDSAYLYSAGPDGHYTIRRAGAFEVFVDMSYGWISGNTMGQGVPWTVKVWDGGSLVGTDTGTSDASDGFFDTSVGDILQPGRRVEVLADLSADITLPTLTAIQDIPTNRVYGKAPAGSHLVVYLTRVYLSEKNSRSWQSVSFWSMADGSGDYSLPFNGMNFYDYDTGACFPAQVGSTCTWPELYYYRPDEHIIYADFPPPAVAADAFEDDNTPAKAKPYSGPANHTFHTRDDVDWISVTVGPSDVGKTYYLQTGKLGLLSDTRLELYAADGTTLIASDDDGRGGFASLITWTPDTAGTYTVKVMPYSTDGRTSGNCDSTYQFFIATTRLYLPVMQR